MVDSHLGRSLLFALGMVGADAVTGCVGNGYGGDCGEICGPYALRQGILELDRLGPSNTEVVGTLKYDGASVVVVYEFLSPDDPPGTYVVRYVAGEVDTWSF